MADLDVMIWPSGPLLFGGDVVDAADQLHAALVDPERWSELEARLGAVGSRIVRRVDTELATVAAEFADVDLAAILFKGWEKHKELREAGQQSLAEGKAVLVPLATHDVTFTRRPSVEVLLEDRHLLNIDCEFKAVLTVEGLVAVVRAGTLRQIEAGSCKITVSLAMEGVDLAKKKVKGRPLVQIPLGSGIPLARSGRQAG
jgi:hypothetical protein